MACEDDMSFGGGDIESVEGMDEFDDYGYGGDDDDDDDEGSCGSVEDNDYMTLDGDGNPSRERKFTVLGEDDIRKRQENDITEICNVLFVSRIQASLLLRYYNWSVSNVHEGWFADEEKVRRSVGLVDEPVVWYSDDEQLMCRICFEDFSRREMYAAACGHPFCGTCWKSYISIAITDGPGCLMLQCPDPKCVAAVDQDMVNTLVSEEDKEKYSRYLLRSYVEASRKTKWCPAPDCNYAVDYEHGSGNYDVYCSCNCSFCWNCKEDAHSPVDCDTVFKWVTKNTAESENTTWILANSKACPKCKRPIEKNQGCMHMTCTPPCKFEFCWLCIGPWSEHGKETGGFYNCNRYDAAKQEGSLNEDERIREMARNILERYTHYYERWAANNKSRDKAIADLQKMQTVHVEELRSKQGETAGQLKFIPEAWEQIIECRRVLKWSYAYGYYLPEHEVTKRRLFEYLQGEAESGLERLHKCAEKDLQEILKSEGPSKDFNEFRQNLAHLTTVTGTYFHNLVQALENGLADVISHGSCSSTASGILLPTSDTEDSE